MNQSTVERCPACEANRTVLVRTANGFPILACAQCELRFVMSQELQRVDYNTLYRDEGDYQRKVALADQLAAGGSARYARARRKAIKLISRLQPRTLLDVGCGVGDFLSIFEKRGVECFGTDVSSNALDLARRHLKSTLHLGELASETFGGMQFDVISCWEVIEHVSDVHPFVRSLIERLRPGGHLFLSTPNYDSRIMWRDIDLDPRSKPPVHVTFWNQRSLGAMLASCGFSRVRVERHSLPVSAARRSGTAMEKGLVYVEGLLLPAQRRTLLALAVK